MEYKFLEQENLEKYYNVNKDYNNLLEREYNTLKDKIEVIELSSDFKYEMKLERKTIDKAVFYSNKLYTVIKNDLENMYELCKTDRSLEILVLVTTKIYEQEIDDAAKSFSGGMFDLMTGKLDLYTQESIKSCINKYREGINDLTELIDKCENKNIKLQNRFIKTRKLKDVIQSNKDLLEKITKIKFYLTCIVDSLNECLNLNKYLERDFKGGVLSHE